MLKLLAVVFLLLIPASCVSTRGLLTHPEFRVVFTSGLDEQNRPIDDLARMSLDSARICIFVGWFNLGDAPVDYLCRIFDGQRTLVYAYSSRFRPKDGSWNTWTYREVNKAIDRPGVWTFDVYLNKVMMFSAELPVDASVVSPRERDPNAPPLLPL
jgi:hypothetical protein